MIKQQPRPAYHRQQDVKRLQELARPLPVRVRDLSQRYVVFDVPADSAADAAILFSGRHEVVDAYLRGWLDALFDARQRR